MKAAIAAAALLFLTMPTFAQQAPNSGTAPEDRGTTGWTGGTRDQKAPEDPAVEARNAATQPWMAEGLDLKGELRQFSPKQTVE